LALFDELKRRNVIKVGIAYIVMAWLVLQVADVILNNIEAPGWMFHVLLLFLGIGFLFTVFFAWAFELTPEGLKREHEVDRSQSITRKTARKLDFVIIGVLLLALSYFVYDKFFPSTQYEPDLVEVPSLDEGEWTGADFATETEAAGITGRSIAVLPFVNMSSDPEQEYFADGLSEELLNLLAKIPELKVASRSSAFYYKGKDFKIEDVGRELNVAHVLEGSVRKAGKQLRITAQLIKIEDGFHLWSNTWDRSLDDIFAIQDEISQAVVDELKIQLIGEAPRAQVVNPEAYALFLKAEHIYAKAGKENFERSMVAVKEALAIEPEYADAWRVMSGTYFAQAKNGYIDRGEGIALAREAVEQALAIDPNNGPAWSRLAMIHMAEFDWAEAEAAVKKALRLAPGNAEVRNNASWLAIIHGRQEEALELRQRNLDDDPLDLTAQYNVAASLSHMGRLEEAETAFRHVLELAPEDGGTHSQLALIYLRQGEPERAMGEIALEPDPEWQEYVSIMVLPAMGRDDEAQQRLDEYITEHAERSPYYIATIYGWFGNHDEALRWLNRAVDVRDVRLRGLKTEFFFTELHDDSRLLELLERIGLPY
jgi:TolB-like protein/Tfp pilus assembly protein PilF